MNAFGPFKNIFSPFDRWILLALPNKISDQRLAIDDIAAANHCVDFQRVKPLHRNPLIAHELLFAFRQVFGEKDIHLLPDIPGTGPEANELFPRIRLIAGFLAEFAAGCFKRLFPWIETARGQFPSSRSAGNLNCFTSRILRASSTASITADPGCRTMLR